MRNRIINILIFIGVNLLFAAFLSSLAISLFSTGMGGGYTVILFILLVVSLLPLFKYSQRLLDSFLFPVNHDDLYVQIIDSILNIENFDELLKETFDQVLRLMYGRMGQLIFYNQGSDEFELYYQKGKKKDKISEIEISSNNVLLKGIKGPNDLLIKGWLDPLDENDKKLIDELDRLGSEIMVPIYYKDTFLGLIFIGEKKRFIEKEIRLIRMFASKIAIHVQNSYYFKRVLNRKELEKEYELTSKIQKKFLPKANLNIGRISVDVYYKTTTSMTRNFYDIFYVDNSDDEIRLSTYHIQGDIKEISILLPGVKALLQCFARLGYSPYETMQILGKIGTEKDVLIGDFTILYSSVRQDGTIKCINNGYPAPLIFKKSSSVLSYLFDPEGSKKVYKTKMESGDLLILACEAFQKKITGNILEYQELINRNLALPLNDLKGTIINNLISENNSDPQQDEIEMEEDDKLFILLKMEEPS